MTKLVNRAKMTTATTGTGAITLGSAVDGYQSFADAGVVDADVVRYVIEDGDNWEIGTGTYTASGTTLTRSADESSDGGTAINLSGSAVVFVTAADKDIQQPPSEGDFVDGDKTKLDGIEANATADQTAGEIKTTYESNSNTNAFTDAEQDKLSGIETGADVTDTTNVTAAGALMDSELTDIASVKALDQGVATTDSPEFDVVTATSFVGDGSSLTGLPSGYTDADVDTHLNQSTATADQVLTWNGSDYAWEDAGGGGGLETLSAGAVGTVALLSIYSVNVTFGNTYAGSNLFPSSLFSAFGDFIGSTALQTTTIRTTSVSGTWRALCDRGGQNMVNRTVTGLFVRIS